MNKRMTELTAQIRELEAELRQEIQRIRIRSYEIRDHGVQFTEQALTEHRARVVHVFQYLRRAKLKHILTAPFIWLCLIPAVLLDLIVSLFQAVCFPVYGIPRVRRRDHIILDRHYLAYLNSIEKLNCLYCGYFNGLMSYVTEVAGRTEQYWCPIKHARQLKKAHDRYNHFTEFGDAEGYRNKVATVRRDFGDIENPD
ncbi:MAG: hypothetical protein KDI28_02615 [Pseudomonadales bacterium]|nr:hypothetical protein [Pseudomonadales bacterium]MCP5357012.1 hypothetical protein [Pseudomonadales bacterium]